MIEIALEFSGGGSTEGPQRCRIDSDQIAALFDEAPRPSVIVMKTARLEKLLRAKGISGRIGPIKGMNTSKGLSHYFKGRNPVALNGKYGGTTTLLTSLTDFLMKPTQTGDSPLHFLGVSSEIFDELAAQASDTVHEYAKEAEDLSREVDSESFVRPVAREEISVDWRETFRGKSPEAQMVRNQIDIAANSEEFADKDVLILGPTGSGKEVVAKAIHNLGRGAAGGPLVAVNCAAIAEDMLEADLFGVARGAATGVTARMGLWEFASVKNGTLFLNEVGELSLSHQAKILRALQEHEILRVGGREAVPVTARIIADTNRELFEMADCGEYRLDLAYRLTRLVIRVPTLAARRVDIEDHAQKVWREEITGRPEAKLSPGIISILLAHTWPGSVRELTYLLETTFALCLAHGNRDPDEEMLYKAWEARGDSPLAGAGRSAFEASLAAAQTAPLQPRQSLDNEIERFSRIRPQYEKFAEVLERILESGAREFAPVAMIATRAKSVAQVAENLQRNGDLVEALPDLCSGRVVVHARGQANQVIRFVERYFSVDSKSTVQSDVASQALGSGYRPVSLVVSLDETRAKALADAFDIKVPDAVLGLEAEIEIRTVLEQAWANVNHEMAHGGPLPLPEGWRRELDELSRVLQAVDISFSRLRAGFRTYRTTYPAQLTLEETHREIQILENVLAYGADPGVAVRLAKLAISIEEWDRAIEALESDAADGYQPAMRDLGVAICQKYRLEPECAAHQKGQEFLERAAAEVHCDPDAMAALAATFKRSGQEERARDYYGRAHALDVGDPYALWGLLEMELGLTSNVDFASVRAMDIGRAIERCRDQTAAKINLPWAWFDLGKFLLLNGEEAESMDAFARGIESSRAGFMIQTTIESLDRIAGSQFSPEGLGEARRVLREGLAARFSEGAGALGPGDG